LGKLSGHTSEKSLLSACRISPSHRDLAGKQQPFLVTLSSAQSPMATHAFSQSLRVKPQKRQPWVPERNQLPFSLNALTHASPSSWLYSACPGWLKPHQSSPAGASTKHNGCGGGGDASGGGGGVDDDGGGGGGGGGDTAESEQGTADQTGHLLYWHPVPAH